MFESTRGNYCIVCVTEKIKEKNRKKAKAYRAANLEKVRAKDERYRVKNRKTIAAKTQEWKQANPAANAVMSKTNRIRRQNAFRVAKILCPELIRNFRRDASAAVIVCKRFGISYKESPHV